MASRNLLPDHRDITILTADDVAQLLGVDRKTVYNAAHRGDIPHQKIGRRLLFERGSIVHWLRQGRVVPNPGDKR